MSAIGSSESWIGTFRVGSWHSTCLRGTSKRLEERWLHDPDPNQSALEKEKTRSSGSGGAEGIEMFRRGETPMGPSGQNPLHTSLPQARHSVKLLSRSGRDLDRKLLGVGDGPLELWIPGPSSSFFLKGQLTGREASSHEAMIASDPFRPDLIRRSPTPKF